MRAGHQSWLALAAACALWPSPVRAADAGDGTYGRLDGDMSLSIEAGASMAIRAGEPASGSLAARAGVFYLQSLGLVGQYNDALTIDAAPLARSVVGIVELRPLFLGRFAQDTQHGPAHLDLFADSFAVGLGMYGGWQSDDYCGDGGPPCSDLGMELSLGAEISFLPQANSPFLGLHGALRWSFNEAHDGYDPFPPQLMLTACIGYHHVLLVHLVDADDRSVD